MRKALAVAILAITSSKALAGPPVSITKQIEGVTRVKLLQKVPGLLGTEAPDPRFSAGATVPTEQDTRTQLNAILKELEETDSPEAWQRWHDFNARINGGIDVYSQM